VSADDRIAGLAADLSEGRPVDWAAAHSSAESDEERATLEELRAFAELLSGGGTLDYRWPVDELSPGSTWGPLTIVARVGGGRYGTVYRARDARLERDVALKLLTGISAGSSPSSQAIEEARLLARVRHPNVLTVHGAESIDGQVGIWSEFVEGRTLDQVVREHGPLSAQEAAGIGIDLCRALSAVHQAGLLHRDIKAQNVMREAGGRIVLMDFGTGHDPSEIPARPGDLSGTPLYLAPEVFAGGAASIASDVYALAVLLFHILTADYPVPGQTIDDVRLGHRRGGGPSLREFRPDLPSALVTATEHGLATDPVQRYSDARAFEAALADIQSGRQTPRPIRRGMRGALAVAAGVVATVAVALVWWHWRSGTVASLGEPFAQIQPLTFTADASRGAVSPDGQWIAYARGSNWDVNLRRVGSGDETLVLAGDPDAFNFWGLTFTPDGKSLDVVRQRKGHGSSLWRVSVSGAGLSEIVTNVDSAVGWSPDGQHMAFIVGSALLVADADGRNARSLVTLRAPMRFVQVRTAGQSTNRPAWSPDGHTIAAAVFDGLGEPTSSGVLLVDTITGRAHEVQSGSQLSLRWPQILEAAWVDDLHLLMLRDADSARQEGAWQVWLVDVSRDSARPLTGDPASYRYLSLDANRRVAIATRRSPRAGIWVGPSSGQNLTELVQESSASPKIGSVNNRGDVAYTADSVDGTAIWVLEAGRNKPRIVARGYSPAFLPSGDELVFLDQVPRAGLYRVNIDGSNRVRLAEGLATHPQVTPDGYVLFNADWSGVESLWQVPAAGGGTPELLRRGGDSWSISSDGRRVRITIGPAEQRTTIECDLPHCREPQVPGTPGPFPIFLDGRGEVRVIDDNQHNLSIASPGSTDWHQLTTFLDRSISGFTFSPDGRWVAVSRYVANSDLVLIKGFR
jgi:Tol biopolymer transport system component